MTMTMRCLTDHELARYLDGSLPEAERVETERHLSVCSSCRIRLVESREVRVARPLPADRLERAKRIGRPRAGGTPWAWAMAAMIALAILGVLATRTMRRDEVMRDARPGSRSLLLIAPADASRVPASALELRWEPVAGALRYEVRIVDARGDGIAEEETVEPRFAGAGSRLRPGTSYFWSVRARFPDGRVTDSETRSFVVE